MPRPFFETLRELRSGVTLEELAEKMSELVHAVRATGKGGQLKLSLTVKPASRGDACYRIGAGGKLDLSYELWRAEKVIEAAAKRLSEVIKEKLPGVPLYVGSPGD